VRSLGPPDDADSIRIEDLQNTGTVERLADARAARALGDAGVVRSAVAVARLAFAARSSPGSRASRSTT
jgi:hypothetical protein